MPLRYDVFLSYNSADQPAVEELAQKLRKKRIKPFFDKWELIPGEPSQEALEKALDESRTCAVFVGQGVLGPWQTEEMRSAIDEWVGDRSIRVIPVLLPGAPDPKERKLPRFLRRPTWVDFRAGLDDPEALRFLVSGIRGKRRGSGRSEEVEKAGASPYRCMAQPPEGFIRRSEYEKVLAALCPKDGTVQSSPAVGITTALRGAGGFGKTSLAQAICFDEKIRSQYPDGILWKTMGDNLDPDSRLSRILDLIRGWTKKEPPGFKNLEAAGDNLREILNGRRVLVVVDDVWSRADVTAFQGLGNGSAVLITTRDSQTLPPNSDRIEVDAMASREAALLLRSELPAGQERDFESLAACLGEWPLLLKLVNRHLREMVKEDGLAISDALREVRQALDSEGFAAFNRDDPNDRHAAADRALSVSLGRLAADEQKRFLHLAVFPEDVDFPLSVVERFWGSGHVETQRFCRRLYDLSLLLRFDRQERTVRLHDVFRQILVQRAQTELTALHQTLLERFKPANGQWADLPIQEIYLWRHLADHLRGAGRESELRELLFEFRYLEAKLKATDVNSLLADYELLAREDPELRRIQYALRLSANVLALRPEELACQILGRLLDRKELGTRRLLTAAMSCRKGLWLRPRNASLIQPGGALIRTLEGHANRVNAVAVLDGRRAVTASADRTLRIWDLESGRTLKILEGHSARINAVAVLDDCRAVSASIDGTLRVWDLESGRTLRALEGHTARVNAVAVLDGCRALSGSADGTLRVWDLESGQSLRILAGHTDGVHAVVVLDGDRAVSASADGTLRVWELESGQILQTLEGHKREVRALAVLDGGHVVSGSDDRTLRVWDLASGQTLQILKGHMDWVRAVAVLDGQHAVSGADDRTLRVWDLESGRTLQTLEGHKDRARAVAMLEDRRAVSVSDDRTLRVWDLESGQTLQILEGHTGGVQAVALLDGGRAVSASDDQTLRLWDLESGQTLQILEGHTGGVRAVVVLEGRRALSASDDGTLRMWDLESGRTLQTLEGHEGGVRALAVLAGGRTVSASADRTLRVWDLEGGRILQTLKGHTGVVRAVVVLNNRWALSASNDRTLRMWDLESGEALEIMTLDARPTAVVVSRDGRIVVVGDQSGRVHFFDFMVPE